MMNIIRLPEVLILSLKRFGNHPGKISAFVDFPFEGLDMAPYLAEYGGDKEKEDTLFDLFAVTNHLGSSMGYGHYTSYVKRPPSGLYKEGSTADQWFEFNDSRVTPVSPDTVLSPAAYVLYYRRRRRAPNFPL
jgi:ubiquitin C-terminal hydrolase